MVELVASNQRPGVLSEVDVSLPEKDPTRRAINWIIWGGVILMLVWSFVPAELPLLMEGRGAEVTRDGQRLGFLGEVAPAVLERYRIIHPVVIAEVVVERL